MDPALVSVIIPCHNQGHFLGHAIKSVWRSAQLDVETVVVDDGSSDDTEHRGLLPSNALCQRAERGTRRRQKPRPAGEHGTLCPLPRCRRRAGARRAGCRGGGLAAHPMAAFVFGRCRMMADDGTPVSTLEQPRLERDHYRELLKRNHI